MDQERLKQFIATCWDKEIVPTLTDYIRIPNKSPAFDPDWDAHGHMGEAVALYSAWARDRIPAIEGATLDVVQLKGRTPLILIDLPGTGSETVLLYGHLDKQPEMVGWSEGLGPWTPVLRDGRLYGRGGADDGYAMFGALSALLALAEQNVPRARCVIVIEACEESGSTDLPFYVDHLADRLGRPSLVVCLDSGCGNYEQLWLTTSLRGMAAGTLSVRVLEEGVHSGDASGIVPSSFRILSNLIRRIENEDGVMLPEELRGQIPPARIAQAKDVAKVLGKDVYMKFPFAGHTQPVTEDLSELILNRTWRPQLAVTGMAGLPEPGNAGNVMLPVNRARLSVRLPPLVDATTATKALKRALEAEPPYRAEVSFETDEGATGWNAPALAPWLEKSVTGASQAAFGKPPAYMGEGGTIPFMAMLGEKFPATQFVVTGVLGPHSNAHGPNEFLDIATGKAVSACVAMIVADHYQAHAG